MWKKTYFGSVLVGQPSLKVWMKGEEEKGKGDTTRRTCCERLSLR